MRSLAAGGSCGEDALRRYVPLTGATATTDLVLRAVGRPHLIAAVTGRRTGTARAEGAVTRLPAP